MPRYKKPASEIILSGQAEYRPQRYSGQNLSLGIPLEGYPLPPKGTTAKGKKMWSNTIIPLIDMGVISMTDVASMEEMLCIYQELQTAKDALKRYDKNNPEWFLDSSTINTRQRLSKVYLTSLDSWMKISGKYGLTPSDRRNLPQSYDGKEEEELDPLAEIGL